jgi:DNA processing protein
VRAPTDGLRPDGPATSDGPGRGRRPLAISFADPRYPALLAKIHQPPATLDVLGDPALLSAPAVAVVGSRRPSREGLLFAERLAADLAARGLVVVSGLAFGIDTAAHRGALATGRTVAVLASGVDVPPVANQALYRRIAGDGAIVSEFERGVPARKHHFLQRNRIISGLALGTVVVEAAERSGALITARHAREQDREVFAVPASPLRETSVGVNALLKDGAALVRDWRDVVHELAPHLDALPQLTESTATRIRAGGLAAVGLLAHLGAAPVHVDELQAAAGRDPAATLAELSQLEISGLVRQLPGKYFVLAAPSGAGRGAL